MARGLRALTQPLSSSHVAGREAVRTRLLLTAMAIVLPTAGLFGPTALHAGLFATAVLAVGATALASLVPACWAGLNRVGGLLIAVEIAILVAATGGADSPYAVFYGMLLIYATMFYGTRRLTATAVVLVVLVAAPYVFTFERHSRADWTRLLVEIVVWAAIGFVTHELVKRIRAQTSALAATEQRYRSLFTQNPDAVFSLDRDGRFTSMNAAGGRLVGLDPATMLGGDFHPFVAPEELPSVLEHFQAVLAGEPREYELTVVDVEGRRIPAAVTNFPVLVDHAITGVHSVLKDISDRKALHERLTHAALHDPLTGLANRTLLRDRLDHAVRGSERSGAPVALLIVDLDGFKPVNDTHGHAVGDALLVEIAAALAECTRSGDTLARLGGDEFALVLPGADHAAAVAVAQRMLHAASRPAEIDGVTTVVGASIGIAVTAAGATEDQLLREADTAMYAAKHRGGGRHVVFSPALATIAREAIPVNCDEARAWAAYMVALRSEIAERKHGGSLAGQSRVPASLLRVLQRLLRDIERLPHAATDADLPLPERSSFEEFVFHQTMGHHWADAMVRQGILTTFRTPAADRFWSRLEAAARQDRDDADSMVATGGAAAR